MNAEFNWWLLVVGLVVGAGLVWFIVQDSRRREADVEAGERIREAAWLSATLAQEGWTVPPEAAERLLDLHRAYLEAPPPDEVPEPMSRPARASTTGGPTATLAATGEDRLGVGAGPADLGE